MRSSHGLVAWVVAVCLLSYWTSGPAKAQATAAPEQAVERSAAPENVGATESVPVDEACLDCEDGWSPFDDDPNPTPSLEDRDLGEHVERDGEPARWEHKLPFLAQSVIEQGFDLPNPYGLQAIGYWQRQDLVLENLEISVNGGPTQSIDFVDFGTPFVQNATGQFKADAWIFPFLNVYTAIGGLSGDGEVPISIEVSDLLDFLGIGLCNGVIVPGFCSDVLRGMAKPEYRGVSLTFGGLVAMGWRDFFVTTPVSYAFTWIDIVDSNVQALNISPRAGYLFDLGRFGSLALYSGATYLKADVRLKGKVSFDTSSIPGLGPQTTVEFEIDQRNKDRWNMLVGANWDLSRRFAIQAEAGFLGSRTNVVGSVTYRF